MLRKKYHTYRLILVSLLAIGGVGMLCVLVPWLGSYGHLDSPLPSIQADTPNRIQPIAGYDKQRGAHVFGIKDSTDLCPLARQHITWITLVSWGFQDDYDSPLVSHHNGDSAYIRQHDSSWVQKIQTVRAAGFKVFLKPHLWIGKPTAGKWRADIFPTNEANWQLWANSYRDFILRYARIAEKTNAEMFCVGVEFSRLSVEKPEFWQHLIQEVRNTYCGKITYAANWYHEFEFIPFWGELDFIGIQAYFPLATNAYPSVDQISKGWSRYLPDIVATHQKYHRKVLFTEIGYRSTAHSAIKPWEWIEHSADPDHFYSAETQANCYEAFFNTVWGKEWFAGVHIWQVRTDFVKERGKNNLDFTPQGKPAEEVIAKGFE